MIRFDLDWCMQLLLPLPAEAKRGHLFFVFSVKISHVGSLLDTDIRLLMTGVPNQTFFVVKTTCTGIDIENIF